METAIITALLSAFVTLLVCLINNYFQVQKQRAEFKQHAQEQQAMHSQTLAIMEIKIDALQKSVEKHNNVIERVYALERDKDVFSEQIKVANHRIQDLEDAVKEVS